MKEERKKLMAQEAEKIAAKEQKANETAIHNRQDLMQKFMNLGSAVQSKSFMIDDLAQIMSVYSSFPGQTRGAFGDKTQLNLTSD